jgi:hypothetical protein
MKQHTEWMILIASGIILAGCVSTTKEIARMATSTRTDVFVEVTEGNAPAGFVDLVIKASIKTPLAGYYAFQSKRSARGKPGCPFLLNIDGQAVLWKVDGQKETIPLYDENGKTSHDPDAGVGMKYYLEKKIRLALGTHRIFFVLPEEHYYTAVEIPLKEAETSMLEFKPRYRYKTLPTRIPTFLRGVDSYEITLNGQIVRQE